MKDVTKDIDITVINLTERKDRREFCLTELSSCEIPIADVHFLPAKKDLSFPLRGCALSHGLSLAKFLFSSEKSFLLVLEDDFEVIDKKQFTTALYEILKIRNEWDVAMLAHNQAVPIDLTSNIKMQRILNAQTASAYIVQRHFTPTLMKMFFEAGVRLGDIQNLIEPNKSVAKALLAHDIWWKSLQNAHRFVGAFPRLVVQRPSYSDIEKKYVDYQV